MTNIREELCRLIRRNDDEQWVFSNIALQQLQERCPKNLIPGLIDCLQDGHPDVRRLAIEVLAEARAESAIPAIMERLSDDDWVVQVVVVYHIRFFGPSAAGAIPYVEPWLESPNEYLRLLAARAILALDARRTDLLPQIWDALTSDIPCARYEARVFFGLEPADDS